MKKTILFSLLIILLLTGHSNAQLQVGDSGVTFDESKFDDVNYPQMREWVTAGVRGGIPLLSDTQIKKTINASDSAELNAAINEVADMGGGALKLNNGTYTIDAKVSMKSNVRIIGESKDGVIFNITMTGTGGDAIDFDRDVNNAGIDNLTIQGGYGVPNDFTMENSKPDFMITSVNFYYATDCWLSGVKILNSGNHGISVWRGGHLTIRDCYIERSWNKGDGGKGYVQFQTSYCLVTNTTVKKMRHLAIQSQHAQYNVFYKNNVAQDFNFHNSDSGNNLVEQNTSVLPVGLGSGWHAVMGPWSNQHNISANDNFVYKNSCTENNNAGAVTFSDNSKVYLGARAREQEGGVFVTTNITPAGGTFYPVVLSDPTLANNDFETTNQNEITTYPNPFENNITVQLGDQHKIRSVSLIDMTGRSIFLQPIKANATTLVLDFDIALAKGTYFLQMNNAKQVTKTIRIMKTK